MKLIFKNPKDFLYIDYLINPIPGLVILLMTLNDHYFKYQFAGLITGKLSDFCGMFYFPLFLCAGFTLIANLAFSEPNGQKFYINKQMMFMAIGASLLLMVLVKLSSEFNHFFVFVLNLFGFQNQIIKDPTDLISFTILPFSYWYAQQFFKPAPTL